MVNNLMEALGICELLLIIDSTRRHEEDVIPFLIVTWYIQHDRTSNSIILHIQMRFFKPSPQRIVWNRYHSIYQPVEQEAKVAIFYIMQNQK